MTDLEDLRVSWAALASGPESDGHHLATLPLGDFVEGEAILVGRDLNGNRHMLVPTKRDRILEDISSDAVQIRELVLGTKDPLRFTDVVCKRSGLADVFDDLILAMLRRIDFGGTRPTQACAEILDRWRALLKPPPREVLSANQMAGLVAELRVAMDLLERDPERRIDIWTGTTGARHDFRRGDMAIEVKASLSRGEAATEIHGLDQLAEPPGGRLWMVWMRLERVPEGALSVARMVEDLRKLIGGSPVLYERLTKSGWRPESSAEHLTFEIRETRYLVVDQNFPRLIPSMLSSGGPPLGVGNVRYEVALGPLPVLTESEAEGVLDAIARGRGK